IGGRNGHATGHDSIVLGGGNGGAANTASAENSAILGGAGNTVEGHDAAVVAGYGNIVKGARAVAMGNRSVVSGDEAFAIGDRVIASGMHSMATGYRTEATTASARAMGVRTEAKGYGSTTMGFKSLAVGTGSLAIGGKGAPLSSKGEGIYHYINAKDYDGMLADYSDAFTTEDRAKIAAITDDVEKAKFMETKIYEHAGALGGRAYADGSMALGTMTVAGKEVKSYREVENEFVRAEAKKLGLSAEETEKLFDRGMPINAIAQAQLNAEGKEISSENVDERILQLVAKVEQNDKPNEALRKIEAVAMGYRSKATEDKSIALGFDAKAEHENSVALGSQAATKVSADIAEATVNGIKYGNFAGTPNGVVSIGKEDAEKQLVNVAAGAVTETSTDAINGSQLFATNKAIGNVAKSVKNNFGGNAALNEDGNITFTNIGGTGKGTIHEAIGDIKTTADAAKRKTLANSTALDTKLDADDITSKDKSVTIDTTTTAGKVDLKINVDDSTIKVNDEGQLQAVASAPEVDGTSVALNSAGKVSVKDKGISAAKLADNAVTEDKIADALLTELKAKSREKVKAGAGIKVSPTTVAADKDNQEFTVSLSDAVKTKLDNLAANPNATYLN
ncbi:hypothetical protein QJU13_09990, partial [Pasteurella atlantica]|nr:hypothetical protein [Pasteurella atlantica]